VFLVLRKKAVMLLAQEAWNSQDGQAKRISGQVLTVEFAALLWDSSVNGALLRVT
jgi:hypothetical protein